MGEVAVSVKDVTKNFKLPHEKVDSLKSIFVQPFKKRNVTETQRTLKDISFEIKKGEFFGIVGRNGSGKSTLLKLIAGIYQPTQGSIKVQGRLVPFIELGVGFNPELTGRENVYLNGALMGFSRKEIARKYDHIVEFAELERFMDQKLKNYSSGMQVRLAFSVATILGESEVLLIDEVLAVGDAEFQRKCFDYFRSLKKQGKTVVFVTHDMNAVIEYCDRAILIENGDLVMQGNPEKIATAYKKLFQPVEDQNEDGLESDRWGDEAITILTPKLSKKQLTDNDKELTLTFTVKANIHVESPIIGFSVVMPSGGSIVGMNNEIKQHRIKFMNAGEEMSLTWIIPNVFSDGQHYVNLDVTHGGGTVVADRWDNALSFRVKKIEITPYVVSPLITLDIKKREGHSNEG